MLRSTDRILTTHAGSLPRPVELTELLLAPGRRGAGLEAVVERAVGETVRQQGAAGLDVVNDGEQGKVSFATYVTDRLTGFEGETRQRPDSVEQSWFPDYYEARTAALGRADVVACGGPIAWKGDALVQNDLAALKAA